MAPRGIFGLVSLVLVAGGLLLMFLVLLNGAVNHAPVNKFYLLQADTANIPNAPSISRWSYWNVCGADGDRTVCGDSGYSKVHPAFPLDPASGRTFDTTENVPEDFINKHSFYFYMTRCMFSFMLIALFFGVLALFTGLLALCTRIGSYLSGMLTTLALIFQAVNASLMTAAYIKGRNSFRSNGQSASIGKYAFGFQWAAFACFFLSTILFCLGGSARKESSGPSTRRGFFKGKRSQSTRSRGSFVHDKEYGS